MLQECSRGQELNDQGFGSIYIIQNDSTLSVVRFKTLNDCSKHFP